MISNRSTRRSRWAPSAKSATVSRNPQRTAQPRIRAPIFGNSNVQRWHLDLSEIKMINVPDEDMPKYRLEDGDVLLCEGNSADLVGRGAIWQNEIPECVHQNHVLRVRMDKTKAIPEFVLAVINSSYGQAYFRSKAKRTTISRRSTVRRSLVPLYPCRTSRSSKS